MKHKNSWHLIIENFIIHKRKLIEKKYIRNEKLYRKKIKRKKSYPNPFLFFNWDSLQARLNSHYEAWSNQKKKYKKIKSYRKYA